MITIVQNVFKGFFIWLKDVFSTPSLDNSLNCAASEQSKIQLAQANVPSLSNIKQVSLTSENVSEASISHEYGVQVPGGYDVSVQNISAYVHDNPELREIANVIEPSISNKISVDISSIYAKSVLDLLEVSIANIFGDIVVYAKQVVITIYTVIISVFSSAWKRIEEYCHLRNEDSLLNIISEES